MKPDASAHSLLILSCDIVGSTAYKQRAKSPWRRTFLSFYREFPQQLSQICHLDEITLQFGLWKGIGDELLYTCPVSHPTEVFLAVRTWLKAMSAYEGQSLFEHGLATKGGAFVATFPGPDSECAIPRDPTLEADSDEGVVTQNLKALQAANPEMYQYDFFGPSIDTGFRLISESTQRYFTLSVEAAYAMLYCESQASDQPATYGQFNNLDDLVVLNHSSLKGVWGDRQYPILALDRQIDDPVHQAQRLMAEQPSLSHIARLCHACLNSDGWPSGIYLPDVDHEVFRREPVYPDELVGENSMEGVESEPQLEAPDPAELGDNPPTD